MQMLPIHQTLIFKRHFPVSPSRLFAAYADVKVRSSWCTPSSDIVIIYQASDFRIDGEDRFKCGAANDLKYTGYVRYLDILAPNRIVYSEVMIAAAKRLTAALVTWEISRDGANSNLLSINQVVSFAGSEMITGHRDGMEIALDNLDKILAAQTAGGTSKGISEKTLR